jgi:hypothetical protein
MALIFQYYKDKKQARTQHLEHLRSACTSNRMSASCPPFCDKERHTSLQSRLSLLIC